MLACVIPVISCGEVDPPAQNPAQAPPTGAETFFPKQKPPEIAYDSLARGRLVVDDRGCLRLRDGAGTTVPLWPPNYELDTTGNTAGVLDANGTAVVRVGEKTTLGGGGVGRSTVKDDHLVNARTGRELFERCPDSYFLVQGE